MKPVSVLNCLSLIKCRLHRDNTTDAQLTVNRLIHSSIFTNVIINNDVVSNIPSEIKDIISDSLVKYSISFTEDAVENKNENDDETILSKSFFIQFINNLDDVLDLFFHVVGHKICTLFWKKCNTNKELFTDCEIAVIEDLFLQSIVYRIYPSIHHINPAQLLNWNTFYRKKVCEDCLPFYTLYQRECCVDDNRLTLIHNWLYSSNTQIFEQDTFDRYIKSCLLILSDHKIKKCFNQI